MIRIVPWLWAAGGVQLMIATANFLVPKILSYGENLAKVSRIVRQVFVLHSIYILLVLIFFSGLCLFFAPELASGRGLGRFLSASMAAFWLLRALLQFFYVDADVKGKHGFGNLAYTLATVSLSATFAIAALGFPK